MKRNGCEIRIADDSTGGIKQSKIDSVDQDCNDCGNIPASSSNSVMHVTAPSATSSATTSSATSTVTSSGTSEADGGSIGNVVDSSVTLVDAFRTIIEVSFWHRTCRLPRRAGSNTRIPVLSIGCWSVEIFTYTVYCAGRWGRSYQGGATRHPLSRSEGVYILHQGVF